MLVDLTTTIATTAVTSVKGGRKTDIFDGITHTTILIFAIIK